MVTKEFIKQLRERSVDDGHVFFINRYSARRIILSSFLTMHIQCVATCIKFIHTLVV